MTALKIAAAGLFLALSAASLSAPANAAASDFNLLCKPQRITGTGIIGGHTGLFAKMRARRKARIDWRNRVTGLYGASWAKTSLARNKSLSCVKHFGWICYYKAKPCKKPGLKWPS